MHDMLQTHADFALDLIEDVQILDDYIYETLNSEYTDIEALVSTSR